MRTYSANDLRFRGDILDADGSTVLAPGVACGIEDLQGRRLEQAQLTSAETTHLLVFRGSDAAGLPSSGYVQSDGVLYIVDYVQDPRRPRAGMWAEVYCHVERRGN